MLRTIQKECGDHILVLTHVRGQQIVTWVMKMILDRNVLKKLENKDYSVCFLMKINAKIMLWQERCV